MLDQVTLTVDGREVAVPAGTTILGALDTLGIDTPTLCYDPALTPVNACRVCVVELEGARLREGVVDVIERHPEDVELPVP